MSDTLIHIGIYSLPKGSLPRPVGTTRDYKGLLGAYKGLLVLLIHDLYRTLVFENNFGSNPQEGPRSWSLEKGLFILVFILVKVLYAGARFSTSLRVLQQAVLARSACTEADRRHMCWQGRGRKCLERSHSRRGGLASYSVAALHVIAGSKDHINTGIPQSTTKHGFRSPPSLGYNNQYVASLSLFVCSRWMSLGSLATAPSWSCHP